MTMVLEETIRMQMSDLLAGEDAAGMVWPEGKLIHAWRVIRWEADVPLTDEQRAMLKAVLPTCMQPAGIAAGRFSEDGDMLTVMACLTQFPARAHRETVMWLCCHALMEECSVQLEQEGTMYVGEEFAAPEDWLETTRSMREVSDWWTQTSPFSLSDARNHRTHLQTIIKRRQYQSLGGYVTRALRTETEINRACFGFVPLMIEAVWSQHAELSLKRLTEELNLNEMTRKPREALMAWIASLQSRLRESPAAVNAAPIERVIAGIQADCSLPYSQANLSRSLGLTPAYFCRLFHEKTGEHFSTFLTQTRMAKAQELLSSPGTRTLQEVSQACGYPNKSYFCQVFKKYTGLTPGEYEQQRKAST